AMPVDRDSVVDRTAGQAVEKFSERLDKVIQPRYSNSAERASSNLVQRGFASHSGHFSHPIGWLFCCSEGILTGPVRGVSNACLHVCTTCQASSRFSFRLRDLLHRSEQADGDQPVHTA